MFGYSWGTILIILVIVLILFGPKRLPELGDSIGKAIRSFKKAHEEPPGAEAKGEIPGSGSATTASQPTLCSQCRKELGGDFAFCPHCGHQLKA